MKDKQDNYGLHNLKSSIKKRKKNKRIGRGESSGYGKTSGRGHKGQKSRKSGHVRIGFEGGQNQLIRRVPKIGFNNNNFKNHYAIINLRIIALYFTKHETINIKTLKQHHLIHKNISKIKILGNGNIKYPLNFDIHYTSKKAKNKIITQGGTINLIKPDKNRNTK